MTNAELEALADEIAARLQDSRRRGAVGAVRVADFVDHTLLKAEATRAEIVKLCAEAREHRFAAVCVNATWVELSVKELDRAGVAVATVVGFPLGATTRRTKAAEAAEAVGTGAGEIDMVAAIGRIKGGQWACVEDDIRAVVEASRRALVKVIVESAVLTPEEIVKTCALAKEAGADYVKTSTGFHPSGGATTEAVRLMRLTVGDDLLRFDPSKIEFRGARGQGFRFVRFRRIKRVALEFED